MTSDLTTARIKRTLAAAKLVWATLRPATPDDEPRRIGITPDRLTTVELVGPPNDLHKVTLLAGVPRDQPRVAERNGLIMAILLGITVPEWEDRDQWLATNLRQIRSSKRVAMQGNNKRIALRWLPKIGCVSLTIEHMQKDMSPSPAPHTT